MRCPQCDLENEAGAFYCARCHTRLPRPLAPGECPFCGLLSEPGEEPPAVCPSCGNDPQVGRQVRERRVAVLRAELMTERQALDAKMERLAKRKGRWGCLPLWLGIGAATAGAILLWGAR